MSTTEPEIRRSYPNASNRRGIRATLEIYLSRQRRRTSMRRTLIAVRAVLGAGWLPQRVSSGLVRCVSLQAYGDYSRALFKAARGEQMLLEAVPGVRVVVGAAGCAP